MGSFLPPLSVLRPNKSIICERKSCKDQYVLLVLIVYMALCYWEAEGLLITSLCLITLKHVLVLLKL